MFQQISGRSWAGVVCCAAALIAAYLSDSLAVDIVAYAVFGAVVTALSVAAWRRANQKVDADLAALDGEHEPWCPQQLEGARGTCTCKKAS